MKNIDQLIVSLDFGSTNIEVGELVSSKDKIYFKFYKDFLSKKIEISPFKISLSENILSAEAEPFEGLFGVFNDSLPDGWGRLLLDRKLSAEGISISNITPLDRLAFVGSNGMGALTYKPALNNESEELHIELDRIANEMHIILEGSDSEILDSIYQLGGSSGGARPKIFVGFNPETEKLLHGKRILPPNFEYWIIKFPSSLDPIDIANIEYAYYKMALDAGIEMSPCKLFKGKSGKTYFGTKRFDHHFNNRLHMHSASGLMHDNFRLSNMDYGHLMDCAFRLENHVKAYEKIFLLATFNVYAHNKDDHSKNFSFLMNENGEWRFAPAYDLTFSNSMHGHHSTMIAGESRNPGKEHLLELANHFGVKNGIPIINKVKNIVANWAHYAKDAGVTKNSIKNIDSHLKQIK